MTLTELYLLKLNMRSYDSPIKIYIDNDTIWVEGLDFDMLPQDALIEALELLGFIPENV